jgi:hypothetical protein
MEGEKLTRLLRITFTLAETRQRKLEGLERAIQSSRVPSRGASKRSTAGSTLKGRSIQVMRGP